MLKPIPERPTYAQEKLLNLIDNRKLKKWCVEHNFTHTSVYRLALGESMPTYRIISTMCHLIPPIEWLYFFDEKMPFEPQTIPQWDYTKKSKFIKEHRFDYKTVAEKYGLEKLTAYNLFYAYRSYPSIQFMRLVSKDINPIEFFIDSDIQVQQQYIPERGDIVSINGSILLILSNQNLNKKNDSMIGCVITTNYKDGIELEGTTTKGFVNPNDIKTELCNTIVLSGTHPTLIEKAPDKIVKTVLSESKKIFE